MLSCLDFKAMILNFIAFSLPPLLACAVRSLVLIFHHVNLENLKLYIERREVEKVFSENHGK